MKLAISVTGEDIDSPVDERFGRAKAFLIVDSETMEFSVVDNTQNYEAAQGAGIQSAGHVINAHADCVLTGHCGPKAFRALSGAGIKVYAGVTGTAKSAVEAFKKGDVTEARAADVEGHW
jgi:predicted Fe-Mo cluster-binding NifX family protein